MIEASRTHDPSRGLVTSSRQGISTERLVIGSRCSVTRTDLEIDDQFKQQPAALRAEILRELLEAVQALHANAVEDVNKQLEAQRQ